MALPTQARVITGDIEPTKMVVFSQPKHGKTSNLAKLPNALVIDLESGANFFECMSIDIKAEAIKEGIGPITKLYNVAAEIQAANTANGKPVYDFIILDTTSALEDMATVLATHNYKNSAVGKGWQGSNVVTELAQGGGYGLLRTAFEDLIRPFESLAGKCLIYSGHAKTASITKKGESLSAKDINLTGKLKFILTSQVDCTGFLFRKKSTKQNVLSFMSEETDLITGSRIPKLSGREIVISEMIDDTLNTYWEQVFPSINQKPV